MRIYVLSAIVFFYFTSFSYAQFGVLPAAGVTPESPFFFFERFVENIQTLFTFGDIARVKRSVRLAEERLAEAAVLANKDSASFEKSLRLFRKEFDSAIARLERVTLPDVRIIVNESVNKHFIVFEEIRDLVSEQYRPLVDEAIRVSKQNQYSTLKAILEVDPNRAISLGLDAAKDRLSKAKREAEAGKIVEFEANIAHAKLLFDAIISIPDEKIEALREAANGSVRIVELLDEIYEKKGALPDQKRVIERITDFKTYAVQTHIRFLTQLLRKDPKSVVSILTFVISGRLNKMERIAGGDGGEIAFVFPDYENYITFGKEVMKRAGRYRVNLEEETVQDTLEKDFAHQLTQLEKLKGEFISYRESFDRVITGIKEIQRIEPDSLSENQLPDIPVPDVPDNGDGGDATSSIPALQPPSVRIFASVTQIKKGEQVEIRWESAHADSCIASEGWSGTKSVLGSEKVFPQNTTTYVITCSSNSGRASDLVIVTVVSPTLPIVNISSNPLTITNGESSVLTWASSNANTCVASDGWSGAKNISGSQTVTPSATRTYVITCSNTNGSSSSNATVTVTVLAVPTVTISVSPSSIQQGGSSTLTWSSTNATSCAASNGWSGTKSLSGNQTVSPTSTTTYTITCSNTNGSSSSNATVTVTVPPPPPPPPPF